MRPNACYQHVASSNVVVAPRVQALQLEVEVTCRQIRSTIYQAVWQDSARLL
jgi:hypothetical protein